MKLFLKERLGILQILPEKGDFAQMTIKADLAKKLSAKQEEFKDLDIRNENGVTMWNPEKDKGKEIELTELEEKMIKDALKEMDSKKELTVETAELFKKFDK